MKGRDRNMFNSSSMHILVIGIGQYIIFFKSNVPKCSGNQKLLARLKYVCFKKKKNV